MRITITIEMDNLYPFGQSWEIPEQTEKPMPEIISWAIDGKTHAA